MVRNERAWFWRYSVAVSSVAVATLIRYLLDPVLGDAVPFIFMFPAVVLSSWYGGLGPGLVSAGLGAVAAWYLFLSPPYTFALLGSVGYSRLLTFVAASLLIVLLAADLHRTRRRLAAGEKKERAQAERLRVTLASLTAIIESSQDATQATGVTLFQQDAELRYEWLHSPITGYAVEQIVGRTDEELDHTITDVAALVRAKREVLATGKGIRVEVVNRLPDGRHEYYEVALEPRRDAAGRAIGLFGAGMNITARKAQEEALRRSQARLTAALEIAQLGIWEYEPATGTTRWDRRCREIFGVSEPGPIGNEDVYALLHPEDLLRVAAQVRAALQLQGDGRYETEYRVQRRDGELRWVAVRGSAVMTGEGAARRIEFFVGTLMDITELRRTERELRESEAHFRSLANAVPQLVWTARSDSVVDYYNSRAQEYGGIAERPDSTWDWQQFIHADDLPRTLATWQAAVQTGSVYECEHRIRMADGTFRWHLSRALPLFDEAKQIIKWFGTATDINDLRRIQQELRDNDQRKDEFLAMLAHELRNPLAPIRNAVSVLRYLGAGSPQIDRMRQIIDRQAEHLTRIVDDLLEVSRITRGKITLQRQPLALTAVVARAVETSRPLIDAARHQLTVSLPPEPLYVVGDLTRLSQVIANLLNNAAKYTPEAGQITLTAERADAEILIHVTDNGIGIAAAVLPHIFDLFAQADGSLDRAQGGLGIGLTIVKNLVEMHGGRVEVQSDGPGRGSLFTIRLPVFTEPLPEGAAGD